MQYSPFAALALTALIVWGALCAAQDARQRRISNWLTFPALLLAAAHLLLTGHTLLGAPPSAALTALLLALLLSLPGYLTGQMGAADVKLLAALALASSAPFTLISIAGAAVTIALWALLASRLWPRAPQRWQQDMPWFAGGRKNRLPYAPFLFIGLLSASGWYLLTT